MEQPETPQEGPKPTLYDIIGVPPTATEEEIKRQYRRRAMQLHPDRNQDDPLATEKFQQLSEAYEILKDPAKRERYDKFGTSDEKPTDPADIEIFEMMTQILGLGRSRGIPKGPKVSPTIRLLTIPLSLAYTGGKMDVKVSYHKICPKCHGKGSNNGVEYPVCPICNGAGSLSPGGLQFLFPCRNCNSTGYLIDDCYNANPASMKSSLDVLAYADTRTVAVLGDMFELGADEKKMHYNVGVHAAEKGIDVLICIGDLSAEIARGAQETANSTEAENEAQTSSMEIHHYKTKAEFFENADSVLREGDTILVKASHGMEFPEIVERLSRKE